MKIEFDQSDGLVVVPALCIGVRLQRQVRMVVDTGANISTLNPNLLEVLGYGQSDIVANGQVITASGSQSIELVTLNGLESVGVSRHPFPVMRHSIGWDIDGILGLDFFHDCRITIDMRKATIEVD